MLVDIGEMKKHIKPKADSTLRNMRKDSLIKYIRCLEHNYNVAVSFNENQAKYIEALGDIPVIRCKDCVSYEAHPNCQCGYCWHWDYETGESPNTVDGDDYCSYGERKSENAAD